MTDYKIEIFNQYCDGIVEELTFSEQIQEYAKCRAYDELEVCKKLQDGEYYAKLKRMVGKDYEDVNGMPVVAFKVENAVVRLDNPRLPYCEK